MVPSDDLPPVAQMAGPDLRRSEFVPTSLVVQVGSLRTARGCQLSGERRGGRGALTSRLAALIIVAATLGCTSNICTGVATCYGDRQTQCQNVPGCAPTPGCMVNPVISQDCPTAATQDACLVLSGCSWSNGACSGPCSGPRDQATCLSMATCSWSACTGKPKSCTAYSADSCPTSPLGCYVTTSPKGVVGE